VDLDANVLFASFAVGGIGFVSFAYGKSQGRLPQMVAGILLMGFPYFVSNLILMAAITALILGALWLAVRLGW
jgi:hypothetical protein